MKKIIGLIVVVVILVIVGLILFSPKPSGNLDIAEVADRGPQETSGEKESFEEAAERIAAEDKEERDNAPVTIPNSSLKFSFTGFGPGKSHPGTFESYSITDVTFSKENNLPISGKVSFDVESVKTDSDVLDGHLCRENFFDCVNHKQIVFELKEIIKESDSNYFAIGNLTFKEITKEISFPVTLDSKQAIADFKISTSVFGFGAPIVNDDVQITFVGSVN